MKTAEEFRRWLKGGLQWLFPIDLSEDPLSAMQKTAIERNRLAAEENCRAASEASTAITDLLAQMESRRNG